MRKQKVKHESLGSGSAINLQWLHNGVSSAGGEASGSGNHRETGSDVSPAASTQNQEYAGRMEDFDTGHDGRVFGGFEGRRSSS